MGLVTPLKLVAAGAFAVFQTGDYVTPSALGSGAADSTKVLRGNQTWETIPNILGYTPINKVGDTGLSGTFEYAAGVRWHRVADSTTSELSLRAGDVSVAVHGASHSTKPGQVWLSAVISGIVYSYMKVVPTGVGVGTLSFNNHTVWHAGNDGSGSGLDADTLDGSHASAFALSGHNHSGVYEPVTAAGTTAQYWRGDKTWQTLNATAVGLGNVTNNAQWHAGNDGSGSGLDADLLDGYHASTTRNSANTIPIRDANGYLQLGYINSNVGAESSAASHYWYQSGSDGYFRPKTLANVKTEIVTSAAVVAGLGFTPLSNGAAAYGVTMNTTPPASTHYVLFGNTSNQTVWYTSGFNYVPGTGLTINVSGVNSQLAIVNTATNGANIKLAGNGGSTPDKWIRAESGKLQFINSGYTGVIMEVDDAGRLFVGELWNTGQYARMEWGSATAAGTPYFDFHSSGNNIDYDTRFIASGGTGTAGNGYMTFIGAGFVLNATTYPGADNTYACGGTTNRWTAIYAVNGTIQTSDANMKRDIEDARLGLGFIMSLKPRSYRWRGEGTTGKRHYGIIAQELAEVLKQHGEFGGLNGEEGTYGLNYSEFVAPLIRAVQEQQQQISELKAALSRTLH